MEHTSSEALDEEIVIGNGLHDDSTTETSNQLSSLASSLVDGESSELHTQQRLQEDHRIGLKEREEIARLAYKTWFVIKRGHKEIKDQWWALYYKKIPAKYHLRDNYLGKKINQWIEEDLRALQQHRSHYSLISPDDNLEEEPHIHPTVKKRKPNSSKEGSLPAYINVALVHPPKEEIPEHVFKLSQICEGGSIDWTKDQLEQDMEWFRANRQKIMSAIPHLTTKSKAKKSVKQKQILEMTSSDYLEESFSINLYFTPHQLPYDLIRTPDAYWFLIDIPGINPGEFFVQTDDISKLYVRGSRNDAERNTQLHILDFVQQRYYGEFFIEIALSPTVDLAKTEQSYSNGTLVIKCPIRDTNLYRNPSTSSTTTTTTPTSNKWRTLSDDFVDGSNDSNQLQQMSVIGNHPQQHLAASLHSNHFGTSIQGHQT